jgi:hypothetical protein
MILTAKLVGLLSVAILTLTWSVIQVWRQPSRRRAQAVLGLGFAIIVVIGVWGIGNRLLSSAYDFVDACGPAGIPTCVRHPTWQVADAAVITGRETQGQTLRCMIIPTLLGALMLVGLWRRWAQRHEHA